MLIKIVDFAVFMIGVILIYMALDIESTSNFLFFVVMGFCLCCWGGREYLDGPDYSEDF